MSASQPSPPPRLIIGIVLCALAAYLGWGLYFSITDILSFNDFEVFHFIGGIAAQRSDTIYELITPQQQRGPFLYPLSASVMFVPLSWLPHEFAGVLFSIVKIACLTLLWFGGRRQQQAVDSWPGMGCRWNGDMLAAEFMTLPRITIVVCFALLLGVPLLFRPAAATNTSDGAPSGEALSLIIITPHNEQIRFEFAQAFDRWHRRHIGQGVKVIYNVPGGTSEIRKMLESQYAAALERGEEPGGDADMVFGGGSFEHNRLKRGVRLHRDGRDVDEPISQPVDLSDDWLRETYGENKIGDDLIYDKDKFWFGLALSGFGIVYNRDALAALGLPEPDAWEDMCDPRLRGWVALVNPNQSGSVTTAFETILKHQGWIRGWQILRRMAANGRYFSGSSLKPPLDVAMGDAAVGVCIDFYGRFQEQALKEAGEGDRLGYIDPPGGSTSDADPISVLRGAPHPDTAKRFIEFCLSDEGQALWQFAAKESNASEPGALGPTRFELRRLPIKRSLFETHADRMIDPVNPFEIASSVKHPNPNYRDLIAPMYAAMAMDNHEHLRAAWNAIVEHPSYPHGDDLVTADDVADPELKNMLAAFDALPVLPGPNNAIFDLQDETALGEVRAGWVRGGFAGTGLWSAEATPLDALRKNMGAFFREMYRVAATPGTVGTAR